MLLLPGRETLPALSPSCAGQRRAQQPAHLCPLLLVTLGKSLPISELVSISMKQRCLPWEKKKVRRSHGKTCGTQHRVGAWKVTVSFLPDVSSSLALDWPAKAVVQKVGQGRTVSQEGTWCEGG